MTHPFDFLKRLPDAVITDPFEKHPGVFICAALVERKQGNVFIECVFGPAVTQVVYTLNVGGRGALVLGETEFRDIISAAMALFETRQPGFYKEGPTSPSTAGLPDVSALVSCAGETVAQQGDR